jgi:hypothetical protein
MNELKKLIDVKTIVTFAVIAVFCFLSVTGRITGDQTMNIVLVIITFFFAKKASDTGSDLE